MRIAENVKSLRELKESPLSSEDAKAQLRTMARNLIGDDGQIKSGYLRLSNSGSGKMRAGGAFTSGSREDAAQTVGHLLVQAYESELGPNATKKLIESVNDYCFRSGRAIGTRSFVKLIRSIEQKLSVDDGQSPVIGGPPVIRSRINLDAFEAEKTSRELLNDRVAGLRTARSSPISDAALEQFQDLAWEMKDKDSFKAFEAFRYLMFPGCSTFNKTQEAQSLSQTGTFAMGDADGSMGRMVLHAIASGVAKLPPSSLPALARLMKSEVKALGTTYGFMQFQSDTQVGQDLDEIAQALQVIPKPQDGKPACIYLGDILSDRFTNNQPAMAKLIYKLSGVDPLNPSARIDTGVRFIAGNHDTRPLIDAKGEEIYEQFEDNHAQWGASAQKKQPWNDYKALLLNCFKAADYSAGVLTTHNGVVRGLGTDEYLVGVASPTEPFKMRKDAQGADVKGACCIKAKDPKMLADHMNVFFRRNIESGFIKESVSTEFRAPDEHMTAAALNFGHIPGFRQLHGHNASTNEAHQGVSNLNARGEEGIGTYLPVAMVID